MDYQIVFILKKFIRLWANIKIIPIAFGLFILALLLAVPTPIQGGLYSKKTSTEYTSESGMPGELISRAIKKAMAEEDDDWDICPLDGTPLVNGVCPECGYVKGDGDGTGTVTTSTPIGDELWILLSLSLIYAGMKRYPSKRRNTAKIRHQSID